MTAQERPDSAQMARLMELARSGPEHERLAALAGRWDVSFISPMPEMRFTATAGGMPVEALTILGFDRGPAVYTAVGFDTYGHEYEFVWTIHSPDQYTWSIVFLQGDQRNTVLESEYRQRQ